MDSHRSDTPEFTQAELDAAVDECHRVGRKIAVHAGTQPSIAMCVQAGFDSIEHGTFMTVAQARTMKEKGMTWVPTIIAYTYIYEQFQKYPFAAGGDFEYFKRASEAYRDNFKALYDTGVNVVAGTDMVTPGAPVTPVARELAYMAEYGALSSAEVIRTATANAAAWPGIADEVGTLETGKIADILVADGDAAADIAALQSVRAVWSGGRQVV